MATSYDNVIVFGPTGATGGAAALEAAAKGAKVWLAMRDTSKSLGKVEKVATDTSKFQRIQADLTDPASLTKAVQESKAKAAYVYVLPQADHRANFAALQAAGIEWVVLLSSFTVRPTDLKSIPQTEFIAWFHAQAEIALEELGLAHAAVRPAFFATNPVQQDMIHDGQVDLYLPEAKYDYISVDDIGRVSGNLLVNRPASTPAKLIVFLSGPDLLSRQEGWDLISRLTGKPHKVNSITADEFRAGQEKRKVPPPIVDYIVTSSKQAVDSVEHLYPSDIYPESAENIKKYSGRDATRFEDFVKDNLDMFTI